MPSLGAGLGMAGPTIDPPILVIMTNAFINIFIGLLNIINLTGVCKLDFIPTLITYLQKGRNKSHVPS